jgi:hypothetical protein
MQARHPEMSRTKYPAIPPHRKLLPNNLQPPQVQARTALQQTNAPPQLQELQPLLMRMPAALP